MLANPIPIPVWLSSCHEEPQKTSIYLVMIGLGLRMGVLLCTIMNCNKLP